MTILKEGAGGIWHIYDKDTGKGKRIVVRTSHSMQRSKTLKAWQAHFAKAAHEQKAIATAPTLVIGLSSPPPAPFPARRST